MLFYYIGAIIIVVAIAAILLMKKKNNKGGMTESAQEQESVSEAPEQGVDGNEMDKQDESAEEENFSAPVSAEEEKPNDGFNMQ